MCAYTKKIYYWTYFQPRRWLAVLIPYICISICSCNSFAKVKFGLNTTFNLHNSQPAVLIHCVKSLRIRSLSGRYFPAFGLNTERYSFSLCVQSECSKIRTRKTPNMDTFRAVIILYLEINSLNNLQQYSVKIISKQCVLAWSIRQGQSLF